MQENVIMRNEQESSDCQENWSGPSSENDIPYLRRYRKDLEKSQKEQEKSKKRLINYLISIFETQNLDEKKMEECLPIEESPYIA